jgi:tetratricopeptide (TPR) repeat protein
LLQTIIAVVQNDRERRSRLARPPSRRRLSSATAHLALSYALQSRFDLAGARSSVERAVGLDPQDALAWARLAELHASFGEVGEALEAARRASALAPDLSRTRTVLGYARLAEVNLGASAATGHGSTRPILGSASAFRVRRRSRPRCENIG